MAHSAGPDMTSTNAPLNHDTAYKAGREAQEAGRVPLHDITGHMVAVGIPVGLHGRYLAGIEDALEDQGYDTDPDSDGYAWERRALAAI